MRTDAERRGRFEAVATEVYEPLQRYLHRRVRTDDVDDVFNEVLLTLWRRIDDVPHPGSLPYAYGVARRTVANHRRGGARRRRLVERLTGQVADVEPDPAELVDSHDPDLIAALARLSAKEREVVRLWAWEGLEPRQIAEVLGTTANAASLTLSRARRKLADDLEARQDRARGGHRGGDGAAAAPAASGDQPDDEDTPGEGRAR